MPDCSARHSAQRGEPGVDDSQDDTDWNNLDDDAKRQAKEKAEEVRMMYEPGVRRTAIVPGTDGMVSGTALADPDEDNREDESGKDRQ